MWTRKKDGNVIFLEQWRLCCACKRMFNLNIHSHIIGHDARMLLHAHLQCPPLKETLTETNPK